MGFGRIPQLVVPKAKAFGMKVIAYDPYVPKEVFAKLGVEQVDFPTLLKTSDYVSIHSPLVPETKGIFNADAFRQMKKTAYVVNTARGPIIDEAALAAALDAGEIAGAALDVMTQEPPGDKSPLFGRDNVIITPHTSFYSEEALVELQTKAAEEVVAGAERQGAAQSGQSRSAVEDGIEQRPAIETRHDGQHESDGPDRRRTSWSSTRSPGRQPAAAMCWSG